VVADVSDGDTADTASPGIKSTFPPGADAVTPPDGAAVACPVRLDVGTILLPGKVEAVVGWSMVLGEGVTGLPAATVGVGLLVDNVLVVLVVVLVVVDDVVVVGVVVVVVVVVVGIKSCLQMNLLLVRQGASAHS